MRIRNSLCVVLPLLAAGCGSGDSANIPLVAPPVAVVTPAGLTAARRSPTRVTTLDVTELRNRFYLDDGPTNIDGLLDGIDSRINEINTRSGESSRACLSATPVEQSITVFGETVTAYFQCYDIFSDSSGGMVFGKKDDTWYLFTNVGQGIALATVTPVTGTTDKYAVEAWMSVGQAYATSCTGGSNWYDCSYGVIHVKANSSTGALEMTTAGTGIGYCGAQLKSDGTDIYFKASAGGYSLSTWTCDPFDDRCSEAGDVSQGGTCTGIQEPDFELASLGIDGESTFGDGISLDGSATDSVHFGYTVAELSTISGVSAF